MIKILITIFIIIILIFFGNYFNLFNTENFKISSSGSANTFGQQKNSNSSQNFMKKSSYVSGNILPHGTKTINNKNINNIQYNNNNKLLKNQKIEQLQEIQVDNIENRVLFDNKDYNENLSVDNKDNKYFYTDMIDQSNINETAFNVVYSIDPIDYANVKTGLEKCNQECKGICFENGYDGIATCYPIENQPFDWGTLYKNPTFTYGYNAYGPNNLKQ